MEPKIVIGDIHGCHSQLKYMLDFLEREDRLMIFLGDYVNRGMDSKGVLSTLLDFKSSGRPLKFLCGNHDWALRQYVLQNLFEQFALIGGLDTLNSYIGEIPKGDLHQTFVKMFPREHLAFLNRLEPFYEDEFLFCSHTGLSAQAPLDRSFEQAVLNSHPEMFTEDCSFPKMTVCGHYPQLNGLPFKGNNLICVDTGCGVIPSAWLTALFVPEMKFAQVDEKGNMRWIVN
jgi:serine/threonine protein phosphatase 1